MLNTDTMNITGNEWLNGIILPVDDAARYYVFDVSDADWLTIFDNFANLSRPTALAVAINLDMTFIDGRVGLDTYLKGVTAIAAHKDWVVAEVPLDRLEQLAAETEQCPALAQKMLEKIKQLHAIISLCNHFNVFSRSQRRFNACPEECVVIRNCYFNRF